MSQDLHRHPLSLHTDRRQILERGFLQGAVGLVGLSVFSRSSVAAVTDETDNFGDNWWSTTSSPPTKPSASLPTDEVVIQVPKSDLQSKEGLGLELGEVEFRTNRRVYIKSVTPGSIAERLGIKKDWVVVAINGSVRLENQWRRFIGTLPSLFDAMFLPHAFALL